MKDQSILVIQFPYNSSKAIELLNPYLLGCCFFETSLRINANTLRITFFFNKRKRAELLETDILSKFNIQFQKDYV